MAAATISMSNSNLGAIAVSPEQAIAEQTIAIRAPHSFIIYFPDIKTAHSIFHLNKPVELTLTRDSDSNGWACEEKTLPLFAFGDNDNGANAVFSLFEDFAVLWDEIAQVPDNLLNPEAQVTKAKLLSMVKSVTVG